jgi:hypothetical protein
MTPSSDYGSQSRHPKGVAVVGDDHPRLQGDGVVAAVPLLALGLVYVAAGLDDLQLGQVQGFGDWTA